MAKAKKANPLREIQKEEEAALKEEGFQTPTTDILTWSEGMVVEGVYVGRRDGQFRPMIKIRQGDEVFVYATPTVLDNRFADIPEGSEVKIICRGQRIPSSQKGKEDAWDFNVGFKPPKG